MAPGRKRTTRGQRKKDPVRQRLVDGYLADLDRDATRRLEAIEAAEDGIVEQMQEAFRAEFLKIPDQIREMNWMEFVEQACAESSAEVEESVIVDDSVLADAGTEPEETNTTFAVPHSPPPSKHRAPRAKKGTTAKKPRQNAVAATPAIIPRVPPGQLLTPLDVSRAPKPNELLYSVKGSPVCGTKRVQPGAMFNINNQFITLTTSPATEEAKLPSVPAENYQEIVNLKKKLSMMIRKGAAENDN